MHGSFPELGSGESGEGGQGAMPAGIRSTRRGRGVKHQHRMPFGAELVPDGVRFRLWAPKAREVAVALPDAVQATGGQPLYPMQRAKGGWFALTTGAAKAGSRYQFAVGNLLVPDPASRHQPDDVHGPSMVIDPGAYDWSQVAWRGRPWEEIVIYELHVGTFGETGDFAGVERHLDHLAALGVTALELLPIADFPGARNWGYDGVLLYAPDSRYGTPDDLKRLVEACHARGLCLFLDVVYNHFGPDGNYLSVYAPSFFTSRHETPWGAAINFDGADSRTVRDFYIENALYWLEEFQLDGLRFDAVHAIVDDGVPNILAEIAETVRRRIPPSRHVHLILENDRNQAHLLSRREGARGDAVPLYTAQWNDDVHHALRVVTSGQTGGYYADYADAPAAHLGRALAEGFAYQGEPSRHRGGERRGEPSTRLPPTAFVSFIQNHDQVGNDAFGRRLQHLAPPPAVRAAAATYLLAPQIPLLFQGEEWGADRPFAFFCDFGAELGEAVRNGRRREFARFPEFADARRREEIPDPTAPATFEAARLDWSRIAQPPHAEWLRFYRELLVLRARTIVPRLPGIGGQAGSYRVLGDKAVEVRWTLADGAQLTLLANYGAAAIERRAAPVPGAVIFTTHPGGENPPLLLPYSVTFFLAEPSAA
jgi:malto-oligosyltrehalose trehalohydrolase